MSTARKHLGCAVYNDYIYAVGGRDDCTELNSVERYCDKDDRWTPVVAMQMKRSGVGLAVVGGQLLGTSIENMVNSMSSGSCPLLDVFLAYFVIHMIHTKTDFLTWNGSVHQ